MNSIQASQIMGGNGAKARKASDLYPTPPEVTVALMRFLKLPRSTQIWEPACGQGDMVEALRCCASDNCNGCPSHNRGLIGTSCIGRTMREAADLIEFQQRGLEALTKMDEGLKMRGSTLKEFLRRGDEIVQGHRDPAGPPGAPGIVGDEGCGGDDPGPRGPIGPRIAGDIPRCPACGSKNIFWNAEKDINTCADCGWQDKEG